VRRRGVGRGAVQARPHDTGRVSICGGISFRFAATSHSICGTINVQFAAKGVPEGAWSSGLCGIGQQGHKPPRRASGPFLPAAGARAVAYQSPSSVVDGSASWCTAEPRRWRSFLVARTIREQLVNGLRNVRPLRRRLGSHHRQQRPQQHRVLLGLGRRATRSAALPEPPSTSAAPGGRPRWHQQRPGSPTHAATRSPRQPPRASE
jgi:hypothetical protein